MFKMWLDMANTVTFSDCKGNNELRYEVSSPYFKVNSDGSLVALRNVTAVGRTLFVHARTPHAEDMAELVIVGGKDIQGSLQRAASPGFCGNSGPSSEQQQNQIL
ncbi:Cadherin-13 [Tupaia chinensis]|uniref:Cadherin-13 n=1 Tax=Tupaia chinensis TaxID=246437 RepID=L9KJN5_TUPCH|nr:Cadherin-13 [Tupaia chinensis]